MGHLIRHGLSVRSPHGVIGELFRRFHHPRGDRSEAGWATASVELAARRAVLVGMAGWQSVLVLVALVSPGGREAALLVAAHGACLVLSLLTLRRNWDHTGVAAAVYLAFVLDWIHAPSIHSVLLFTAWWMVELANSYVLDNRWWRIPPVGALLVVPAVMVTTRDDLPTHIPLTFVLFIVVTVPAIRIGFSLMIDFTHGVDERTRQTQAAVAGLESRRVAVRQLAEDSRRLHDTAINTLAAVANGGAAVADETEVRRRCREDAATLRVVRAAGTDEPGGPGLRDAIRTLGIPVRYAGLDDDAIRGLETRIPASVVEALGRAAAEAVQNADKHSGAAEVLVTIDLRDDVVVVEVRDDGVGSQDPPRPGGGVERSILQRAEEAGIAATYESEPGRGTTVRLTYPADGQPPTPRSVALESVDVDDLLWEVRTRAAFLIAAGFGLVAAVITVVNHGWLPTPDWLMLGMVVISCGLTLLVRRRRCLTWWPMVTMTLAGPIAFLASSWSVDFARSDPLLWHAVTPVSPLLALFVIADSQRVRILAMLAYASAAVAAAVVLASDWPAAAAINVLASVAGIAMTLGVGSFVVTLGAVVTRAARESNQRFVVRVEALAVQAAEQARRRWRQAGLDRAIDLLSAIGDGSMSCTDPDVQHRCGQQESFLRQLVLLDPRMTHMGPWFAHALSVAERADVELTIRGGEADTSPDQAGTLGRILLDVVGALPGGLTLTAALFVTDRRIAMTLVAPSPHLGRALETRAVPAAVIRRQTLGDQDFAEIVFGPAPEGDEVAALRRE